MKANCVFWWKRVLVLMPCSSIGFLLCALANMSFWSSLRGTKGKPILRMSIYPCEDEIQALIERKKVKVKVLVTQSCPTLCDPMDCSPPDSSVHGILQARILEKVAIPFSRGDLPDPGIKPQSPALQADSLLSEPPRKPPGMERSQ